LPALAATVAIGVFGLFHPQAFEIEPFGASRVEVRCETIATLQGHQRRRIDTQCSAAGPAGAATDFVLSIPGKIRRHYQGTLHVQPMNGELLAVVTMTLETAVASTVAAEAPPNAAPAMLEAQAIVTRSYFTAEPKRHCDFDFCDTTHCQFVKDVVDSAATRKTEGHVLVYRDRILQALYAARCDALLTPLPGPNNGYPYFAVRCDYCLRHPSRTPPKANAKPHHHGMCQLGANDLARQGWSASKILAHYYPGTEIH
jgi:hypothetical protein